MPRYTPLTAVDEKIRDLAERRKVKEPVCSMYLPSDDAGTVPRSKSAKQTTPSEKAKTAATK